MFNKTRYLFLILLFLFKSAIAGYNANLGGEVVNVLTYSSGLVLFRLKNQPASHPSCNPIFFAISTDIKESSANRLFSRLLTAHTTKIAVNIGYDNAGNCGNGYIRVHRIG